jgi:predicted RNase H-like nuclease (RuvC/YqgF family)
MGNDPLERHHGLIAVAERGQQEGHDHVVGLQCIRDLATALRAERERVAELEKELSLADSDVAAKRNYIDELDREMSCAKRLDSEQLEQIEELKARVARLQNTVLENIEEIKTLKARVAELEPDAKLGQMVREMPRNAKLGHEGQQFGEWYAFWGGRNDRQYGPTPEAALEAARKETP